MISLAVRHIADHPEGIDSPCVILRGPAASFGHEEINEAGEIELYDRLVNPGPGASS